MRVSARFPLHNDFKLAIIHSLLYTARHLAKRNAEVQKRLCEAEKALEHLAIPETLEGTVYAGRSVDYFESKWDEKRRRHLEAMDETQKQKRERVAMLLELEERLRVSR